MSIQAPARVTVTKGPLFTRRGFNRTRYLMELWVGDINTGLHWHVNKKEAKTLPQVTLDNAAELLQHYGLMDEVYARYEKLQSLRRLAELPAQGSKVRLTISDLEPEIPLGSIGTVTKVDAKPDQPYPLSVAFAIGDKSEEVPVELQEVEAV